MKEYKLIPKTEGVTGHLLLKIPSYVERLKFMKDSGIQGMASGEQDIGLIIKMMEAINLFVLKVDVTLEDEKVTDMEELGMYQKGTEVINEVVSVVAGGIPSKGKI